MQFVDTGEGRRLYPTRSVGDGEPRTRSESAFGTHAPLPSPTHKERIRVLVEIAAANASSISLHEILDLLPRGDFPSSDALRRFIEGDEHLSRQLTAVGDELTLRGQESLAATRTLQRDLAERRLVEADRFLLDLTRVCPWIELAGVSGSTAYSGAKPSDDTDFFLVTRRHRLWVTLLVALAAAKVYRLRSPNASRFCFNRLTEVESCERTFRENRDPLFAREALSLRVLRGRDLYAQLVRAAPWMQDHFPGLYVSRMVEGGSRTIPSEPEAKRLGDLVNAAAFLLVAPYLWMAGLARNVRLRREGRDLECFRTVVRRDFWATESSVFDELREAYRRAFA